MNLIGSVDGQEIRFDFLPPGTFRAVLPTSVSGTHILELHAVDDAGNVSSYCSVAVLIDFDSLSIEVLQPVYQAAQGSADFSAADMGTPDFYTRETDGFQGQALKEVPQYLCRELV